jgi:hypothetical protein
MKDEALKLALGALEEVAARTGARWALEQGYAGHLEAITAIKQALAAPDLQAELDATNRQVEILSDALAESRRDVDALVALVRADEREVFNKERQQCADWLDEAAADIEDWGMYASEYLQQKWDLPDQVQDYKNRAAAIRARSQA